MSRWANGVRILLMAAWAASAGAATAPEAAEFSWHAIVNVPAGASMARVALPASALQRLQSRDARDVRVFNGAGEAVAFALRTPAASPATAVQTPIYDAHPLFAAAGAQRPGKGAVEVRMDTDSQRNSVWVHWSGGAENAAAAGSEGAQALPSALFDTRKEKRALSAFTLQADLPANVLMHFSLAISKDLAHWTPVDVRGPLFRFDGADAPVNQTLVLAQAVPLDGHYLRLDWQGQSGVRVRSLTATVAQADTVAAPVRAALPNGNTDGDHAVVWSLDFATPLAGLDLRASRDNTLVPVRIWGRNDAAQPWRLLANTVVYRVGAEGQQKHNAVVPLGGASARWLRVESSNGMALAPADLQATAELEALELVFLASGPPPYVLAAGRANTSAGAVAASLLGSVLNGNLADVPLAELQETAAASPGGPLAALQGWLPAGTERRSVVLWVVLLAAVLVLAAVAYALLRQLSGPKP